MSIVEETGDSHNINYISNSFNINKLSNTRIIQKQLVYIVGLSYEYAFNKVKKSNKIYSNLKFSAIGKLWIFRAIWKNK